MVALMLHLHLSDFDAAYLFAQHPYISVHVHPSLFQCVTIFSFVLSAAALFAIGLGKLALLS